MVKQPRSIGPRYVYLYRYPRSICVWKSPQSRNRKSDGNWFSAITAIRPENTCACEKLKKFISKKKNASECVRGLHAHIPIWCRLRVVAVVVSGSYIYTILLLCFLTYDCERITMNRKLVSSRR